MEPIHQYSHLVSQTLDCLGYNTGMVKYRVNYYRQQANDFPKPVIIAGSKGEGLSAPYQSDVDYMDLSLHTICTNEPQLFTNIPGISVFATDNLNTPPGYTRLKLMKFDGQQRIYNALIASENGQWCLSSDLWVRDHQIRTRDEIRRLQGGPQELQVSLNADPRAGPSEPVTHTNGNFVTHYDHVSSITYFSRGILNSWTSRQRNNNWPARDLILDISRTHSGFVVPVGLKGSDDQHMEWRICFTLAELALIHNFNDTQTKVYVLLKMVAKEIIQPVCKEITSYVMKNVALWMAEFNPQESFREELLIDRLIQSLCFLRHCVLQNVLPSYMIPERNLLARKLNCHQRRQVATILSDCIQTGGSMLLRCGKLRVFMVDMYRMREDTIIYGKGRDLVECLHSLGFIITGKTHTAFTNNLLTEDQFFAIDKVMRRITGTLHNLVVPEWQVIHAQGINPLPLYFQRLKEFLS